MYQTLSSVVASYLRRLGIHTIVYLDDFGCAIKAHLDRLRQYLYVWKLLAVMYLAGYTTSIAKSMLRPDTILRLLRFGIDTNRQRFFVPRDKMSGILTLLKAAQTAPLIASESLQSLTGTRPSPSFYVPCTTQSLRPHAPERSKYNYRTPPTPIFEKWNNSARGNDFYAGRGCSTQAYALTPKPVVPHGEPWCSLETAPTRPVVRLLRTFARPPSTTTYTVRYALDHFERYVRDCFLDVHVDNTIVQYTALSGKAIDYDLREFARFPPRFQLRSNAIVRIHRVATEDNIVADAISREKPVSSIAKSIEATTA